MPKQIKFDEDARRALERGVNKLADAWNGLGMVLKEREHLLAQGAKMTEHEACLAVLE